MYQLIFKLGKAFALSMIFSGAIQAGVIEYNGKVQAGNITDEPWVLGSTMWGSLESANGTATSSTGFKSLIGLDLSLFTFNFGDLELSEWLSPGINSSGWEFYSEGDSSVQPVRFYYDGVEWAFGSLNFIQTDVDNLYDATATGSGSLNLESGTAEGMDFYTEVMALSSGTGIMNISINNFDPVNNTGLFNSSGSLSVSPVPEPSSLALFGLGGLMVLGLARRKRNKQAIHGCG